MRRRKTRPTKSPQNAQDQQRAGETAGPVEQAWVALEQVAEEAACGQQRAHPQRGADGVEEEKRPNTPCRSARPPGGQCEPARA